MTMKSAFSILGSSLGIAYVLWDINANEMFELGNGWDDALIVRTKATPPRSFESIFEIVYDHMKYGPVIDGEHVVVMDDDYGNIFLCSVYVTSRIFEWTKNREYETVADPRFWGDEDPKATITGDAYGPHEQTLKEWFGEQSKDFQKQIIHLRLKLRENKDNFYL